MIDYEKLEASRNLELEGKAVAYLLSYGLRGQESLMSPQGLISAFIHGRTGVSPHEPEEELEQAYEVYTAATTHHPAIWNNAAYVGWLQQNWAEWYPQIVQWSETMLAFGIRTSNVKAQETARRKSEEALILSYLVTRITPFHAKLEEQFQTLRLAHVLRKGKVRETTRDLRNAYFLRPTKETLKNYLDFVEGHFISDRSARRGEALPDHAAELKAFAKLESFLMLDSLF